MANRAKLIIQTLEANDIKYIHFCYIDRDIFHAFKRVTSHTSATIMDSIAAWASIDFNMKYPKLNSTEIHGFKDQLRYFIKQKYKDVPVELLSRNLINGWVTRKMKEEIADHGFSDN